LTLSFKYLGMVIGQNPRTISFWKPIIKKLSLEWGKGGYFSWLSVWLSPLSLFL